ncbi:DUF6629 family protein [Streptomyces sp. NPDC056224]|uniref:DUF6629 family protein n=1 Tax=Streptomyces sp. NPDC056224 TaxID=3345750 RepID=UPI0035DA5F04
MGAARGAVRDRARPAAAAVCAVLWRLEFASTWCAFAAVASLLILGRTGRPEAAGPVTRPA